jgi:hypothetical protein
MWHLIENKSLLEQTYTNLPSLKGVGLLYLKIDKKHLSISFELPSFPDKPLPDWELCNLIDISLVADDISDLKLFYPKAPNWNALHIGDF